MARTREAIQQQIIDRLVSEGIQVSSSSTSIRRMWTFVFSFFAWLQEMLFDTHVIEVDEKIKQQKWGYVAWYRNMALKFQYGSTLVPEQDYYDNTGLTESQIAAQKIITQAAAVEEDDVLKIKVRTAIGVLTVPQRAAFESYVQEFKGGGVDVDIISAENDKAKAIIDVWYNPQIINSTGGFVDGTNSNAVRNAANAYLTSLTFNGKYQRSKHEDSVQALRGVEGARIRNFEVAKFTSSTFTGVDEYYQPYSGFLEFYNVGDLVINLIPKL